MGRERVGVSETRGGGGGIGIIMNEHHETLPFGVIPPDPPNSGILFVDHSETGRSGHLGHALVEVSPGVILAFYPNCSAAPGLKGHGEEWNGHNGDGWMEYKRSEDGGQAWSAPAVLEYAKHTYDAGDGRSVMCEKAVRADDGAIVLFNLECDISTDTDWGPARIPTYLRSIDGGYTWSAAQPLGEARGRVFDAMLHGDAIYALQRSKTYCLHVSTDHGRTFAQRSVLPFDAANRCYGAMQMLHDGSLIAYAYNRHDEQLLDYAISRDDGLTWAPVFTAFFAKKIRNPQIKAFKDGFVLHGRSGNNGDAAGHLVLYTSRDGIDWDAGRYLCLKTAGDGAYSNSLLVGALEPGAPVRLLIQASHAYRQSRTNVLHWWLE